MSLAYPNDYFAHGDVFETLDACDQLDLLLGRLRRQRLLDDTDLFATKAHIAAVRRSVEHVLEDHK